MVNTFSPFGFRPFGRQEGGAPTAGFTKFAVASSDANAYFTGDVVTVSSNSIISNNQACITFPSTNTAGQIAGIFWGCEFYNPSVQKQVWSPYFPGNVSSSSPGFAYVITDPDQLFIVQGTTTAVLGASVVGQNIGFASSLQAAGNTTNGQSNEALNSSAIGTASYFPFRIVDLYSNWAPPGVNGTSSGSEGAQIMVVQMNNCIRSNLTAQSSV